MEGDPFLLIEGMAIAGLCIGATYGYIYVRSEYPDAVATLREALEIARSNGYLGANVGGSGNIGTCGASGACGISISAWWSMKNCVHTISCCGR